MIGRGILCAALAAPLLAAAPAWAQAPGLEALPGVRVVYYDVQGANSPQLRAALDARRPVSRSGERHDALTEWYVSWRPAPNGACDPPAIRVQYSATITLPRLADRRRLPPRVLADWERYYRALTEHEAGHIRLTVNGAAAAQAALRAAPCNAGEAVFQQQLQRIWAADRAYDVQTNHGRNQGAVFPGG